MHVKAKTKLQISLPILTAGESIVENNMLLLDWLATLAVSVCIKA